MKRVFVFGIGTAAAIIIIFCTAGTADAAVFTLSPGTASVAEGNTLAVVVQVDAQGTALNAAESTITFPASLLQVESIDRTGIFSFWAVEPTYSNVNGTISFSGGLPTPGYSGSAGTIITVTFRGTGIGTASIVTSQSRILANDGQGTDLLVAEATIGNIIITEPVVNLPDAPAVSSGTHADENTWYRDANPSFTWTTPDGATGFSFALDDQAGTIPDTIADTTSGGHAFSAIGDGIWYFHVRAENADGWGETAHFRIQIDITPPDTFVLEFLDGTRVTSPSIRVRFVATDALSGVDYYEFSTGEAGLIRLGVGETDPFTYSGFTSGAHSIIVRAYDRAGNSREASGSFTFVRPNPPVIVIEKEDQPDSIIVDTINQILPKPVRDVTDQVSRVVKQLQQNSQVVRIVEEIITPVVSTTAAVTAVGVASTITALQLSNVVYLFLRLGYLWFVPVAVGKRRKPWGVVFDSTTNQPVRRTIIRIFSKEFNKLKETQITDAEGRFGFLIERGQYFVTAAHAGYTFPSKLLRSASATPYENIYLGETIAVKEPDQQSLAINVPIDPDQRDISVRRVTWLRVMNVIGNVFERLSLPLLIVGTLASWIALIVQPTTNNYLFLMVYGLLVILKYLVAHHYERSWGAVTDAATGQPVGLAVVRIYDMKTSNVVGTRVSNGEGLFQALVAPGKYYLVVVKSGYESFQSKPIVVTREKGIIELKVKLRKKPAPGEQAAHRTTTIELEQMGATDQAFTPPPLQDVEQGLEPEISEKPQSAAEASASPFAPPELHTVEKKKDSFAKKKPPETDSGVPE